MLAPFEIASLVVPKRSRARIAADRKRQRIANHPSPERRRAQWRAAANKRRGKT